MTVQERLDVLRTARWLRGCAHVGAGPRLRGRPSMSLQGGTMTVGSRCTLSSRPVVSHFVAGPAAVLAIGDDVSIGHGAAVAAFDRVEIGSGTRIGPFVIIMDTNFHDASSNQSVQHDCRPVMIGRDCVIGSRVTITRGASIGDGAEILAGSVVASTIPARVCAGGGRARIVGRAGDRAARWDGAAAMLPVLIMDAFHLGAPPDIDKRLADIPGWSAGDGRPLVLAIEAQFGVSIEPSSVVSAQCIGDVVAAVADEQAKHWQPPQPWRP